MDVDELYGLPLERFVAERGTLARALRAEGRAAEAAELTALRKPSVAAWAVNQLVRTQGRAVADLCNAGDELRSAQADVVAGRGDARSLRAAVDRERTAVDALVSTARGLLTGEGHELSSTIIDRVADTMHAAALDDDARASVRTGRLERELRHVGLGVDSGAAPSRRAAPPREAPPSKRAASPPRPAPPPPAERTRIAEERAAARRLEREHAATRKAARIAESETRRQAELATRAVRVAEERRERAVSALSEADDALAKARAKAEAADDRHRDAQQALESL